ncbi:hypothetical protein [Wolbachia endosymbiont of Dactylopius coccus]
MACLLLLSICLPCNGNWYKQKKGVIRVASLFLSSQCPDYLDPEKRMVS